MSDVVVPLSAIVAGCGTVLGLAWLYYRWDDNRHRKAIGQQWDRIVALHERPRRRYPYAIEVERTHPGSAFFGESRRLIWVDAMPSDPNPFPKLRLWWSLFSRKGAQRQ